MVPSCTNVIKLFCRSGNIREVLIFANFARGGDKFAKSIKNIAKVINIIALLKKTENSRYMPFNMNLNLYVIPRKLSCKLTILYIYMYIYSIVFMTIKSVVTFLYINKYLSIYITKADKVSKIILCNSS